MPQVHFVKRARKNNPVTVKGESYYWWWGPKPFGHGRGVKKFSKSRPKASQLAVSEYMSQFYALEEEFDLLSAKDPPGDVADSLDELASQMQKLGEEQLEKFDNMPDGLQQGDTGQLLEGRADACEQVSSEIEAAAEETRELAQANSEDEDEADLLVESFEDHIQNQLDGITWDSGG